MEHGKILFHQRDAGKLLFQHSHFSLMPPEPTQRSMRVERGFFFKQPRLPTQDVIFPADGIIMNLNSKFFRKSRRQTFHETSRFIDQRAVRLRQIIYVATTKITPAKNVVSAPPAPARRRAAEVPSVLPSTPPRTKSAPIVQSTYPDNI